MPETEAAAVVEDVEAEETPSGPEETVAETEVQPETENDIENDPLDLNPEIPEDVRDMFEEPDFEAEVEAETTPATEEEFEDTYEEPGLAEERKARLKAEKRAAWLEQQRASDNRSKWRAEAIKYAPLSEPFLDEIDATSRRGFLRDARKYHDAIAPIVNEKIVKPFKAQLEAAKNEVTTEAKEDAERAWGKPLTGPGKVPADAEAKQRKIEEVRQGGSLVDIIKARLAD